MPLTAQYVTQQNVDLRFSPRRRVFKDGIIQANGIGTACIVRNISETGALLTAAMEKPAQQLILVVVSEQLIKKCKVVWRDGSKIGVMFV